MSITSIESSFYSCFSKLVASKDSSRFSYFSGKCSSSILDYILYFISAIDRSNLERVFFIPNTSLEASLFTFFFVFLDIDVVILPSDFSVNSALYQKLSGSNLFHDSCLVCFSDSPTFSSEFDQTIVVQDVDSFLRLHHDDLLSSSLFHNSFSSPCTSNIIFTSSGSTGTPKLIPLSIQDIDTCFMNCHAHLFDSLSYQYICSVHSPSFVIILPFLYAFLSKSDSKFVAPKLNSKFPLIQMHQYLDSADSALVISVPTILRTLYVDLGVSNSSINIISCGEPLDLSLACKIKQSNPYTFHNLYGCTEVSPWILYLNVLSYFESLASIVDSSPILPVGRPFSEVSLLLNANDELLVFSHSVFSGYLEYDNTQPFLTIGEHQFYNTGDKFQITDGYYYCNGRSNSATKICGMFINPSIIESFLKFKFNFDHILCLPNSKTNTLLILCFLSVSSDPSVDNPTLKSSLKHLVSPSIPITFQKIFEKPKLLSSGKIDRQHYFSTFFK